MSLIGGKAIFLDKKDFQTRFSWQVST